MSLVKEVKKYGFHNVAEVTLLTSIKQRTLYNWFEKRPKIFEIFMLGAAEKQRQNLNEKK